MYYIVDYSDYDIYVYDIIEGPEINNWQSYCDNLITEAIESLMKDKPDFYIGWCDIRDAVVEILKQKGYKIIRFETATFHGASIIDDRCNDIDKIPKSMLNKLLDHNRKIHKNIDEEIELIKEDANKKSNIDNDDDNNVDDLKCFPK